MTSSTSPNTEPRDADPIRLPTTASPRHYDLRIAPDLEAATFSGEVLIELEVHEPVTELVCNAAELTVTDAWVESGDDGTRLSGEVDLDEATERLRLGLDSQLPAGSARLHLAFTGTLNDRLRGFYRSTFADADGTERTVAVTQFEATDARRAFPCWDEPAFKASFGVTLDVADDLLAISNGPEVERDTLDDHRVRVRFADTMAMSTYLVAFVVGPLETTRTVDVDGVPLRIVHRPGQGHLAEMALEVGAFALRYLTDYYGIPYPGEKVDMVGVPDFAFGAMENLGCVIYRETLLLVDPATATQAEQLNVVDVIGHELAHMWFGDLVTMSWWNGIWLNEAFASFMEMKCSEAFRPQWQRWLHFGRERSTAFDVDALETTRPIEYPVHTPADAEGMFDTLTYQKGSAVVRMLEQYLGEERFRDGIRRYLRTHAHANTETGDLWDALEAETGEPVRAMMDSWIFQGGFPLVGASRVDGAVALTQEPFRYLGHADSDTTWHVPVVARGPGGTNRAVLAGRAGSIADPGAPTILNGGGHGFYRVAYDAELYAELLDGVESLEPLERYALVDDTVALMLKGDRSSDELLALLERLAGSGETDLSIWQLGTSAIDLMHRALRPDDRPLLSDWVLGHLQPVATAIGTEPGPDDDDRRRALRGLLLDTLGSHGDPDALRRARRLFSRVEADAGSVDSELGAAAVRTVAAHATAEEFAQILDHFRTGATPQEQMRYLHAAARVRDPALFTAYLDLLASGAVRSQNLATAYRAALRNVRHGPTAWIRVRDSWDTISATLPFNATHRLVEGVSLFGEPDLADDVSTFLLAQDVPQAAKLIAQHLERMETQVAFTTREQDRLAAHLAG